MKKAKRIPLFKCNVIHSLPGRVRIGCRALQHLKKYEKNIEKRISKINVIKFVKVNILTKNILISYKSDIVDQENVVAFIEEALSYYTVEAHKKEREALAKKTSERKRNSTGIFVSYDKKDRYCYRSISLFYNKKGRKYRSAFL